MSIGIILVGAYMALSDPTGYGVGGLFAFMMLSMRVAQPLVGLARLIEDYQEVAASHRPGRLGAQPPAGGGRRVRRHAAQASPARSASTT